MSATAPLARSFALAGALVVCGASPLAAAGRSDVQLPGSAFTPALQRLGADGASTLPFVPGVVNVMPLSLADAGRERPAGPLADVAQSRPADFERPRVDGGTSLRRTMYVSFAALQIMDAVSTRKALSSGAREANPVMGGVVRNSAALFAVKAGTAAATTWFAEKLAKNHPRRATVMMAVLNAAYAAIVAHNYRAAQQ